MSVKVLVIDPIHEDGIKILRKRKDISLVYLRDPTDDEISHHMINTEILLLRGRKLSLEQWKLAKRLKLISRHGVGCDNVDFDLMQHLGITVAVTADANYVSVAEHAVMLMLAASRNVIAADRAARNDAWETRERISSIEVFGAKVLVVGYGRIGRAFSERVAAFGARLSIYDPYLPPDYAMPNGLRRVHNLEASVTEADIISLHLPRNNKTIGLFDADLLSKCKPSGILVNTGRGGIVDEDALVDALTLGRPCRYATDVLEQEPPDKENLLLLRDDVILTPHSAAMTAGGVMKMATSSAQNIVDFLEGKLRSRMIAFKPV